jgi:hypothetical protein
VTLRDRIEKLEARTGLNSCPECSRVVIHIYDPNDPHLSEPAPRYCKKCGRDMGISKVFTLELGDIQGDAA